MTAKAFRKFLIMKKKANPYYMPKDHRFVCLSKTGDFKMQAYEKAQKKNVVKQYQLIATSYSKSRRRTQQIQGGWIFAENPFNMETTKTLFLRELPSLLVQ